jgi:hypothetical protein
LRSWRTSRQRPHRRSIAEPVASQGQQTIGTAFLPRKSAVARAAAFCATNRGGSAACEARTTTGAGIPPCTSD